MREKAFYPGRIWDGTSDTRKDPYGNTLGINRAPDYSDWDQLLAEVISMQESIAGGGVLHVKQFGAVGDGSADDTMAITMAMIAASQTFEALWFGPGLFLVSNSIDLASNVTIYGAGIEKTTIQSVGNGTVFNYSSESDTLVNAAIRDLTINGKVEIIPPALNEPANLRLSNLKINSNFLHLKNVTDFILDGILTNYGGILLENCDFGVLNRVSMLNSPDFALKILTAFGISGNILAINSGNSGVRAETINNCELRIYSKWNTGNQIYVGNSSKGSQIRAFCLGNSDSETGLFIENSENITIGGLFGYHTIQDIYLDATSTNINVRNPSFFGSSPKNLVDYSNSHIGGGGTGNGLDDYIPTKGNILVGDGANWVTRPIGTNWQFMTVQSNDAEWTDVSTDNISQGSTNKYWANSLFDARFGVKTTDDLQEGDSNHYYSASRFNSDFASKSTDDLAEGSVKHYYSDALFQSSFADQTTDDLQQGLTNLYFNASNFRDLLPSMTGHSAEFLSNNGSDLLWSPISISLAVPSGFSVSGNGTNNGDITISMSKTGILKGVGNGIDVATADVDYSTPGHTHVLSQMLDWPDPTGDSGYFLATNGTTYYWAPNGSGTVTSVGLIVPSGFSASDPITTSGNITISTTLSGMIKGTGSGFTAATPGVDYADASHDHTLSDISNWPTPASGQFLSYNGSIYTFAPIAINIAVPSGFGVSGGPTNNGTITINSSLSGIIKGTGGGFAAATPGVDYVAGAHTHSIDDITDFPSQTSHSGAFLTTDGSALSWGTVSVGLSMPGGFSVSGPVVNGTISVTTTLNGILKGNGTDFTVATAGVDYAAAGHTHTTGQITNWPDPTGHNGQFLTTDGSNYSWGSAGGAPSTSKYILQVADGSLPNAQALGALATGLLKSTTTTGVLSIATASDIPDISATYQTVSGMSSYLTTATAASTYQTQAGMSSYLTTASAAATYQPLIGNQSAHYAFIGPTTGAAAAPTWRLLIASDIPDLSATYATVASLGTYLTQAAGDARYVLDNGVSGGQTIIGGTASSNNLTLQSTSNATRGRILIYDGTTVQNSAAGVISLIVNGYLGQTVDFFRVQDSSANVLIGVDKNGILYANGQIRANRFGSGNANGNAWWVGAQNPGATDFVTLGWTSTAYTTGGSTAWLGNDQPYIYVPAGKTLKIGIGTVPTAAISELNTTGILDSFTWNAGATTFSAYKIVVTDTASAAGSLLLNLVVGSTTVFSIDKTGKITAGTGFLKSTPASTTEATIAGGSYDGASLIVKNSASQFFNEVFIVANRAGTKQVWVGAYNDGNFNFNINADGYTDCSFNFFGGGSTGSGNATISWGSDKLSSIKCGLGYNTPNRMSFAAYSAIEVKGNRQSLSAPGFTSGTSTAATAGFNVVNETRDQIAQAIRGYSTQTNDLLQWQKSDGTVFGSINNTGIALTPGTLSAAAATHFSIVSTWNSSSYQFRGIFANITATAYLATSRLMDLQVGGTSVFAVSPVGYTTLSGNAAITGNANTYAGAPVSVLSLRAHATPSNYGLLDLQTSAGTWIGGINSAMVAHGILAEDICTGRLTLHSSDPCPSADQTAKTSINFLPYNGKGRILLYNTGTTFYEQYDFTSLSKSLSGLTANTNYDVFVYLNVSAVPDLYLVAWTNDTTRATSLSNVGDFWYLSTDQGKRFVGTIRTTGTTGQCEDSAANRFVFNYYNRIPRRMYWSSTGSAWTYNTVSTIRILNAGTAHCKLVNGAPIGSVPSWWSSILRITAVSVWASSAIVADMGLASQAMMGPYSITTYNGILTANAIGNSDIPLGYHTVSLTEQTGGSMTADYGGTALIGNVTM